MNDTETIIHIEWKGPFPLTDAGTLTGPSDYGVYQIYGGHPVYGNSALLYIGLAAAQYFGVRIPQEQQWLYNRDAGRVEVYVGRLAGSETPADNVWDSHIRLAERLLIYAHSPPMNTQKSRCSLEISYGQHSKLSRISRKISGRKAFKLRHYPNSICISR